MRGARAILPAVAGAAALAAPAAAYDGEYITYGGFDAVVEAFRYIALFFNHAEYGGLIYTFAAIGFALGAVNAFFRHGRDVAQFVQYTVSFLFGAAFFTAFILPTGNVNVYDPTRNATATVPGVPDGIVIVADLASNLQETAVTIANAASPRLYEDTANGTIFDVVRQSIVGGDPLANEFVWSSVKEYYTDCVLLATTLPAFGLSIDELKNTSTDLVASFAKAQSDGNFTTLYDGANPGGAPVSCRQSWTAIQPQLTNAATYAAYEDAICTRADFDTANAAELARCQARLDEIPVALFAQAAGDRNSYYQAATLAGAMEEAMADINPERAIAAETNRRFQEQASGFFVIANEYGPFIRAAFLAAALSTLPLLFLFIVTPFMASVFRLFVGFFAFVTLWSIIDVGIAQIAHGIAVDAFDEVARHQFGYSALMLAPPASAKSLAVFGATRFIAISFAGLFVVTIFKISGASFAAMTGPLAGTASAAGDSAAGMTFLNPAGRIGSLMSNASTAGAGAAIGGEDGGFGAIRDLNQGRIAGDIGRVRGVDAGAGSGRFAGVARAQGFAGGAAEFGNLAGAAASAGTSPERVIAGDPGGMRSLGDAASARGRVEAANSVGRAMMTAELARDMASSNPGVSTDSMLKRLGGFEAFRQMAPLIAANGDLNRAGAAAVAGARGDLGGVEGRVAGASDSGYSIDRVAYAGGYMDERYRAGRDADVLSTYGRGSRETDIKQQAGRRDSERQFGGVEGTNAAGAYLGVNPNAATRAAESLNAQRAVTSAGLQRQFAETYGLEMGDFVAAQGGQISLTPNERVLSALAPHIGEGRAQMLREAGGTIGLSVGPDMRINNVDVASIDRTTTDSSSSFRGGESVHDAPMISGDTLFNYAMNDGRRGVAAFAAMATNAERQGRLDNFEDIVAREGSHYLAGIAGFNMSRSESASADARVDASAGISTRTPGLNLGFASIRGEARAGVSGGVSDSRASSRNESVDGYNVAIHDAFDRTIGNASLGDMTTRTEAFYSELRGLQQSAIDRSEGVPKKAEDPDGVFGELGDKFSANGREASSSSPMSDEEFKRLLDKSRYKQPGDM
jgi:hypothetical protein